MGRPRRIPCLIIDEVGCVPIDPDAAALFFVASLYERVSPVVSSNKTFFPGWRSPGTPRPCDSGDIYRMHGDDQGGAAKPS